MLCCIWIPGPALASRPGMNGGKQDVDGRDGRREDGASRLLPGHDNDRRRGCDPAVH